jgi:hypothetical protein
MSARRGGFSLEELAAFRTKGPPIPVQPIPQLHACPRCSIAPALIVRPEIYRGRRSGVYMILGCQHVSAVFPDRSWCGSSVTELVDRWTAWAASEASARIADDDPRRELVLAALRPPS